jgi:hypothetical protein
MFRSFLVANALILSFAAFGAAQQTGVPIDSSSTVKTLAPQNSSTFDNAEYSFDLPNATWRAISKKDDAGNAELIYGDRLDGYLQIRKIAIAENALLSDVIDREQNQKLQFLPGYVNGKQEIFKGKLEGRTVNYEFTQSGKPMSGRAYFLPADGKTVYVLRFTGSRDKLRLLRNQTDLIARTFRVKK